MKPENKKKVILEVSLDLKIYFIYFIYSYCMKKSSILISVVFFCPKTQKLFVADTWLQQTLFQKPHVFAIDRFGCIENVLKFSIVYILKVDLHVIFRGAPTHAGTIELSNLLLQLKNERSGSKTVCSSSIIFILNGRFLLSKNLKFNVNETESKMENPTHSFREINHVLQLVQKL